MKQYALQSIAGPGSPRHIDPTNQLEKCKKILLNKGTADLIHFNTNNMEGKYCLIKVQIRINY